MVELKKISEDERGAIFLLKDLLDNERELTFLEIKKGFARGGCLHEENEYFSVIKGEVILILGDQEKILNIGQSGKIDSKKPHAFIAKEDSIISEWGIKTEEKEKDNKDHELRKYVNKINQNRKEELRKF